jgi:segregation and condensation protein A
MASQQDYTVQLERYHGPLDLLLQLILKAEVEITAISLAQVADQYLAHLEGLERVDVDAAGEFLVIAATLVELKSRVVSPREERADNGELRDIAVGPMDAAAELVEQLLAYKAYREAGEILEARRDEWLKRYPAGKSAINKEALGEATRLDDDAELEDIGLYDLVEAFRRIAETVVFDRLGEHRVEDDDTPIELHQADIVDLLERRARSGTRPLRLRSLLEGRTRGEIVGMFIALLELVRQRRVKAVAMEAGDDVVLQLLEPEEEAEAWEDDHIYGGDDEDEADEEEDLD